MPAAELWIASLSGSVETGRECPNSSGRRSQGILPDGLSCRLCRYFRGHCPCSRRQDAALSGSQDGCRYSVAACFQHASPAASCRQAERPGLKRLRKRIILRPCRFTNFIAGSANRTAKFSSAPAIGRAPHVRTAVRPRSKRSLPPLLPAPPGPRLPHQARARAAAVIVAAADAMRIET